MTVSTLSRSPGLHQTPRQDGVASILADARAEVTALCVSTSARPSLGLRDLQPGVRYRAIFPDAARTMPVLARRLVALSLAGVAVRTLPAVATNTLVVDGAIAVLPGDGSDGSVAVLRLSSVVATASELFERVWPTAVPVADSDLPTTEELSWREREVLRLMALGATDEVVAVHLGVSVRTVRRLVAQLMNRLGARSRFQAGAKAADRGWLLEWL